MTQAIPQRIITITITGTDQDAKVAYTYYSPVRKEGLMETSKCDLVVDRAEYCLFVLDYSTTQSGWAIVDTTPNGNSSSLPQVLGPLSLSVMTINAHTTKDTYRFYINYYNQLTHASLSVDPQQGNIPRPL